ncbi:hypothetical protein QBC47DRAFT_157257 [Echria macrotheca]|uniref:Uncharacterized protein n=1 Tax=Echria macrotheca TaxID=438768 RepID=A0AAJ0F714_9PEZI|nr:hypothetical protein QBC47DRAFT_157257 [Echria macrotheca]
MFRRAGSLQLACMGIGLSQVILVASARPSKLRHKRSLTTGNREVTRTNGCTLDGPDVSVCLASPAQTLAQRTMPFRRHNYRGRLRLVCRLVVVPMPANPVLPSMPGSGQHGDPMLCSGVECSVSSHGHAIAGETGMNPDPDSSRLISVTSGEELRLAVATPDHFDIHQRISRCRLKLTCVGRGDRLTTVNTYIDEEDNVFSSQGVDRSSKIPKFKPQKNTATFQKRLMRSGF